MFSLSSHAFEVAAICNLLPSTYVVQRASIFAKQRKLGPSQRELICFLLSHEVAAVCVFAIVVPILSILANTSVFRRGKEQRKIRQ